MNWIDSSLTWSFIERRSRELAAEVDSIAKLPESTSTTEKDKEHVEKKPTTATTATTTATTVEIKEANGIKYHLIFFTDHSDWTILSIITGFLFPSSFMFWILLFSIFFLVFICFYLANFCHSRRMILVSPFCYKIVFVFTALKKKLGVTNELLIRVTAEMEGVNLQICSSKTNLAKAYFKGNFACCFTLLLF